MVARIAGGARYGTRDWLAQRATAFYMLLYCGGAIFYLLVAPPSGFEQWTALSNRNPVRIATLLFWLALSMHSWIGVRNVLMDYVKHTGVRLVLHLGAILSLLALFFWVVQILWKL